MSVTSKMRSVATMPEVFTPERSSMERVLTHLTERIHDGRIAPGQRLITSEISKELGISLAPVREAFHVLAGEGLLELNQNKGARVRQLSMQDLLEGLQILQVVGCLAIRLAAKRTYDPEAYADLGAILDSMMEAGEKRDARRFFQAITASHRKMNDIAGNAFLNPVLGRLHLEYFNNQLVEIIPGHWERYIENYRTMGKVALQGPARYEKLEKMLFEHFAWVISLVEERLETNKGVSVSR